MTDDVDAHKPMLINNFMSTEQCVVWSGADNAC
jgi:hypothetical protein